MFKQDALDVIWNIWFRSKYINEKLIEYWF